MYLGSIVYCINEKLEPSLSFPFPKVCITAYLFFCDYTVYSSAYNVLSDLMTDIVITNNGISNNGDANQS